MKTGEIFAIDRRIWSRVCDLGVNAAISFLVIARGTGGDNRTTSWSVNAIEKYTSVSRPRAIAAVKALIEAKLLVVLRDGKRPQYRIALPSEVPGIKLTVKEKKDFKPEWIWMPNSIVDGLADETPPVEILRQAHNITALRHFGSLYHQHDLQFDGGIGWREGSGFRLEYTREKIFQRGEYTIWGFPGRGNKNIWRSNPIYTEFQKCCGLKGEALSNEFWAGMDVLTKSGLLEFVECLVNADSSDGEIIHPLPVGDNGEKMERRIRLYAENAAVMMLPEGLRNKPYWARVPVLQHLENVQLVGVARLRYRPQTAATAAWLDKGAECEKWVRAYEKLIGEATENIQKVA